MRRRDLSKWIRTQSRSPLPRKMPFVTNQFVMQLCISYQFKDNTNDGFLSCFKVTSCEAMPSKNLEPDDSNVATASSAASGTVGVVKDQMLHNCVSSN